MVYGTRGKTGALRPPKSRDEYHEEEARRLAEQHRIQKEQNKRKRDDQQRVDSVSDDVFINLTRDEIANIVTKRIDRIRGKLGSRDLRKMEAMAASHSSMGKDVRTDCGERRCRREKRMVGVPVPPHWAKFYCRREERNVMSDSGPILEPATSDANGKASSDGKAGPRAAKPTTSDANGKASSDGKAGPRAAKPRAMG
ncbi:hypothetical protein THAOC_36172 [Thalassiosira oceanica]|uniref:Uncharacterized protein n=1 Tax=Thalassiosira oceanica TaxID=159749 RepID=K0R8W0_THAOC|nr:hypothetical protein THAOC_36172 [Thalassiosira oceanica]|eukprot:EJK45221.1 hypothetical protein THAOC_36172 [Thalassiosira oceanica]